MQLDLGATAGRGFAPTGTGNSGSTAVAHGDGADERGTMAERLYTAEATADGPRTGRARSDDGRLDVQLSRPAAMGGDDGPGTNPEQLFAAGYAACFHSAMRHALRPLGLRPDALQGCRVTADVHFDKAGPTTFDLAVDLRAHLPALDVETAQALMAATHEVCPYSRATRGNVPVTLSAVESADDLDGPATG